MYYLEINKCFQEKLSKFRLENPLEFKELNVRFENTNNSYAVHDALNAYCNNEKVFELFVADTNPQARVFPIINMKAPDGSWIGLRLYGECHRSCTNIRNFTFISDLLYLGIYGRPEATTTNLLNEKCPKICSIFGIVLSSTLMPDTNNIQLIAKFSIGDSINETI